MKVGKPQMNGKIGYFKIKRKIECDVNFTNCLKNTLYKYNFQKNLI